MIFDFGFRISDFALSPLMYSKGLKIRNPKPGIRNHAPTASPLPCISSQYHPCIKH
jgi:hypothetical protein